MITYEIRRKRPPGMAVALYDSVRSVVRDLLLAEEAPPSVARERLYMEKLEYTKFIEQVRTAWKAGQYCTIRAMPFVPGKLPSVMFMVTMIQELHFMAPRSGMGQNLPKCIFVKPYQFGKDTDVHIHYAPDQLRHLQPEELEHVHLRDKEDKGGTSEGNSFGRSKYFSLDPDDEDFGGV